MTSFVEVDGDSGGFGETLQIYDRFGSGLCSIGDRDGDGLVDLAVGAGRTWPTVPGSPSPGSVWIVNLNPDGSVHGELEIGLGTGGFAGSLGDNDAFGSAVASVGDLNGDGFEDLAVGADRAFRNLPAQDREMGNVWILFLDAVGAVQDEVRLTAGVGGFSGSLSPYSHFGSALAHLGDLDGDGLTELAIGASNLIEGGVFVTSLNAGGEVQRQVLIAEGRGGFNGNIAFGSEFGAGLASLGDLDGDGVGDLAVGAPDLGGTGALWILHLNANGSVKAEQEIGPGTGGFSGTLLTGSDFGDSITLLPDLDGDGLPELAVGAPGAGVAGSVWVLFLAANGTVRSEVELVAGSGGLAGIPDSPPLNARFGDALWSPGDLDADGNAELFIGAPELAYASGATAGGYIAASLCEADVVAAFDATPTSGLAPLTVAFEDQSSGAGPLTWSWSFGDGGASILQNPEHTYTVPGTYSVRLVTTGSSGACGSSREDLIVVEGLPASVVERNGSGSNPDVYAALNLPILGTTWSARVDGSALGASGLTTLAIFEAPLPGFSTVFGELLVDPSSAFISSDLAFLVAGVADHDIAVPNDIALHGVSVSTQVLLNGPGLLTNALDLVLGF